jgi:radical SAM protein with 4Fe4S-binding SPASM domain
MYYRLAEPWSLRGYERLLLLLERRGEAGAPYILTAPLFTLLSRCDGVTPFAKEAEDANTRKVLRLYREKGVIEQSPQPLPLAPYQNYRHFANRRVPNVFWSITGRCNQRCIHCFTASNVGRTPAEFTYAQALNVIEQFVDCGISNVQISGGEPLVHPEFSNIVTAIGGAGLRVTRLYTNGVLLSQEILDIFRSLGMAPEIVISFDGLGTHDWMRGVAGAEQDALRAIALVLENGFPLRVTTNVNTATMDRVIETGRYLYGLGVRSLFFVRTSESPKWLSHTRETLSDDHYCQLTVDIIRALRPENKNGLQLKFFSGLTLMPGATIESTDCIHRVYASEMTPESAWCNKCASTPSVISDGRVLPCDAFEGATLTPELSGYFCRNNNIHRRPLREILIGSEYSSLLEMSVNDVLAHNPECRECRWSEKCHGGVCRVCGVLAGAMETGHYGNTLNDLKRKSPITCTLFKGGYYEQVLDLLGEDA